MKELFLSDPNAKRGWYAWWCAYWDWGWVGFDRGAEYWITLFLGPLMFSVRTKNATH